MIGFKSSTYILENGIKARSPQTDLLLQYILKNFLLPLILLEACIILKNIGNLAGKKNVSKQENDRKIYLVVSKALRGQLIRHVYEYAENINVVVVM